MLSVQDYLWFVDDALAGMVGIVEELGDELANARPSLPGANSPYAILTHCLGVMEYWAGHGIAARPVQRDRDAEFVAAGPVAELVRRVHDARGRLGRDIASLDPSARPALGVNADPARYPYGRAQGAVLMHVFEELAQHRGQMELTRDVLRHPSR